MSDLFNNVKPGDVVHYKTPQGQHGKGKVVLRYDTHVVVNRGKGQPQVVNDRNYVKHERGGKVVGALLSRLRSEETVNELDNNKLDKSGKVVEMRNPSGPYGGHPYDWDPTLRKAIFAAAAEKVKKLPGSPQPSKLDTGRTLKSGPQPFRRGMKEENISEGDRAADKDYFSSMKRRSNQIISNRKRKADWQESHPEHFKAHQKRVRHAKELKDMITNVVGDMSSAVSKRQGKRLDDKSHAEILAKLQKLREDSKDAEGAAERVAKTKKHKKKLVNELDSSTLASYVSKAIADRKKAASGKEMAHRIHTPDRAAYFDAKMDKRIAKRSAGIKTAVGKIAGSLPAEKIDPRDRLNWESVEVNEAKAPYGMKAKKMKPVNWQKVQTMNFSVYKSTEGGVPLKMHQMRLAAAGIPSRKSHSPYVGHTALEIPKRHERKASKILYGESVYIQEQPINEVSAPGKEAWIKANKQRFIARYGKEKGLRVLYAKAWKDAKNESVNEAKKIQRYTTHHDEYMVTSTVGPAGHTVSVEKEGRIVAQRLGGKVIGGSKEINSVIKAHTDHPEVQKFLKVSESVYDDRSWAKELMDTNPQASASAPSNKPAKGHYLMRGGRKLSGPHTPDEAVKAYKNLSSQGTDTKGVKIVHVKEAAESKVKKAAEKAISLAKKAKGNKHVDTKPSLDIADKGTGGPMETNQDGDNAKL